MDVDSKRRLGSLEAWLVKNRERRLVSLGKDWLTSKWHTTDRIKWQRSKREVWVTWKREES